MRVLGIALLSATVLACASQPRKPSTEEMQVQLKQVGPTQKVEKSDKESVKVIPPEGDIPKKAAAAPAPAPQHHRSAGPVPAEKSLGWLKNGNTRFIKGTLRADGWTAKDRQRLAGGQKPHAIVLSCSDSRVPPEVVFDQKLGEIFVVRTAGEALDAAAIASIEYALAHLGSNLILVMGHESCGAVKAALGTLNGSDAGSPALNKLVADLHPRLQSFAGKPMSEGALVEGWANVSGVARDLVDRSEIVRDAVASGEVKIQTALYHLGSGVVEFR